MEIKKLSDEHEETMSKLEDEIVSLRMNRKDENQQKELETLNRQQKELETLNRRQKELESLNGKHSDTIAKWVRFESIDLNYYLFICYFIYIIIYSLETNKKL